MWMSAEDARSDFILTAAAVVFGTIVASFLISLPFYPSSLDLVLVPAWVVVLGVLPARGLARYRGQGTEAYGLGSDRSGISDGLLLSLPLLAAGYLRGFSPGNAIGAVWGRLRTFALSPAVSEITLTGMIFSLVIVVVVVAASLLTFGMLTARARDGFRGVDVKLLEALRTYGMGAVGLALLLGLLVAATTSLSIVPILIDAGALVVTILVVDRLVASSDMTTRATILAPAIAALVTYVAVSGGPFNLGFLYSAYRGAMGAGLAIVMSVLIETRRSAWAVVPLVVVSVWAPTCAVLPVPLLSALGAPGC